MDTLTTDNFTGVNADERYPNIPLKYLTASSIIGDKVHDDKDESMGKIEDIMIDLSTGKIDYIVVEFGGFLGIGIKYYAIPFTMLKVDPDKKIFVFDQKKELLEKAPGFDLAHWPDTNFHREETYWSFNG
ncbi:MAG: PRC-barrel domain-containing protein [Chitinophagaceae bacterium]|nr:PRC-barrel domain-containing protein [Chitinophagaceae bacterium]